MDGGAARVSSEGFGSGAKNLKYKELVILSSLLGNHHCLLRLPSVLLIFIVKSIINLHHEDLLTSCHHRGLPWSKRCPRPLPSNIVPCTPTGAGTCNLGVAGLVQAQTGVSTLLFNFCELRDFVLISQTSFPAPHTQSSRKKY